MSEITDCAEREPLQMCFVVPETTVSIQRLAILLQVLEPMDEVERRAALRYLTARWPT